MWKVELECDKCKHSIITNTDMGLNDAVKSTKQAAKDLNWRFVKNNGWLCSNCHNPVGSNIGDHLRYIGHITSPEMYKLEGSIARVVDIRKTMGVIHVIFEDKSVGRYAEQAHWFFEHEFEPMGVTDTNATERQGGETDTGITTSTIDI